MALETQRKPWKGNEILTQHLVARCITLLLHFLTRVRCCFYSLQVMKNATE